MIRHRVVRIHAKNTSEDEAASLNELSRGQGHDWVLVSGCALMYDVGGEVIMQYVFAHQEDLHRGG